PAAGGASESAALGMLDQQEERLERLPQLAAPYEPDTVDLAANAEQRAAWLAALERSTHELVALAERGALLLLDSPSSSPDDAGTAAAAAEVAKMRGFASLYARHLQRLGAQPLAYGALTVRGLLALREQCLRQVGLGDVFGAVKRRENEKAMEAFREVLSASDALAGRERVLALLKNVLAGNMFDWGASQLREALADGSLDLAAARARINYGPPRLNNPEVFAERVTERPYGRVVVFVDNSGADIVLGVLPLARHLVLAGAVVVLAANSQPALNDVTETELRRVVDRAAALDAPLADALARARLLVCATGSAGPCVDLRRLDPHLVALARDADLVVLVGMARAIVSNFNARFACDSLRVAVFKNKMAAEAAGVAAFDSLCLFVPAGAAAADGASRAGEP
ncbi:hypothetical protein IWW38_004577, partial [Coemansia aciculifera]